MDTTDFLVEVLKKDLQSRAGWWDEAPGLAFVYEEQPDVWRVSRLPFPDTIWVPDPVRRLVKLSHVASELNTDGILASIEEYKPESWRGVAFYSESWMVVQDKPADFPDGEEFKPDEVFTEMARAKMLHMHPARQEIKAWWATLADGTTVSVRLVRDDPELQVDVFPADGTQHFEGRVTDALQRIAEAFSH